MPNKYVTILIGMLFILSGCSVDGKLNALSDKYIANHLQYRQLMETLTVLDDRLEIKGVILKKPVLLNMREGYQIEFKKAIKKWPSYKSDLEHLVETSKSLQISYVNLDTNNVLWITQNGGGVLGSDFGFLITNEIGIEAFKSELYRYKSIEGFSGVYTVVY